jgi:hypothetical protein
MQGNGNGANRRHRPWAIIAEELQRESDPLKVLELAKELQDALDAQLLKPPISVSSPKRNVAE